MLSIVVPMYNEEENARPMYERALGAMEALGRPFELLFINDGSSDRTGEVLRELASNDKRLKVINLRRNQGQTAAMMAGIQHARGDIIIPMDGDLQNDPADIGKLLDKLDEGFDVVSGWRKDRKDHAIKRNLPSRMANWLISKISGVHLHDYGCSLKAYRRDVIEHVKLYGEMHRFVPIYAAWQGGRVAEVPVNHYPRTAGKSKYGLERVVKVVLDLIVVKFLEQYDTKPIYVFGMFGVICMLIGMLAGAYAVYLKLFEGITFIQTPLPLLTVMTFMTGFLSILLGLIAELLVRVYYESQGKTVYFIRDTINFEEDA